MWGKKGKGAGQGVKGYTLVIIPEVRGEGNEVAARPGAGQGYRWAVGALRPFLPLADISQIHCAHVPQVTHQKQSPEAENDHLRE